MPAECQLIFAAASRPSERFTFFVVVGLASVFPQPPKHGARIAAGILNDPANRQQWLDELVVVCKRMNDMRAALRGALEKKGVKGDWSHITTQIGMFSFTGLTVK